MDVTLGQRDAHRHTLGCALLGAACPEVLSTLLKKANMNVMRPFGWRIDVRIPSSRWRSR